MGKIFGIGLSGTGTHSLIVALRILGYRSRHYPRSLKEFDQYQALADIPVSSRYRNLDVMFPGSKFILTVRDTKSWLRSRERKPPDEKPPSLWKMESRLGTYGRVDMTYDEDFFIQAYERYHAGVHKYFADRPDDFLALDIIGGDGWENLCPFLGREIPDAPFPCERRHIRTSLDGKIVRPRKRGIQKEIARIADVLTR